MIDYTVIGKEFGGIVRYLKTGRRDQSSDKQAEILGSSGVSTNSPAEMIADFNTGRALNPKLGYAVWHTSLSFNPDDTAQLDSAKMLAIAEGYLKKMGLDNTQYVIVRHRDIADNQHLHIIANRVDNDGNSISDGRNFYRSKQARKELIVEFGLTPIKEQRPELQHPERFRGIDLARYELLTTINQALTTETKRPHLLATLQAAGIGVQERFDKEGKPTGISFEKDGYSFKGSALGRHLSSAGIDKQLAANELKQQTTVTLEITTASLLPASVALGAGLGITPASPEKTESVKLPEAATGQPPVAVNTPAVTIVREHAAAGETSAAAQQDTAERDRIKEQAVAAVAAYQREKELITAYEEQANQAYRESDFTRFAELKYDTIPAAEERMNAYEAEAKSTPIGIEILAKQKELDTDKVQKSAHDTPDEQLTVAIVAEPLATTLQTQQLVNAQVVSEETPVSKALLEISPSAPHHAVAMQAEEIGVSVPELQQELTPQISTTLPTPKAGDYLQEPTLAVSFSKQEAKAILPDTQNADATAQQPPAQPATQRQVDEEAAREALVGMLREQALIQATQKEADLFEREGNYMKVAELRYGHLPEIEQRLAGYRQQAEATPVGRNLLAEQEQAQDKAAKEVILAAQEEKKAAEAQAAEQQAAQVAVERVRRERTLLEVSRSEALQAEQQGDNEKAKRLRGAVIPQAERHLADYQLQAEATVPGRTLLAELNAQEKARQLAGEVLGQVVARRGFISHEEFNQKATGSGYHLPPKSNGQPQQVVELSSGRQFEAPLLGGEQFDKVVTKAMLVELDARAHQKTELNALEEARARYGWGGKEVVRIRVSAAQVESLQKNIGSNMLHPDAKPGADGRIGISLIYNPHADDITARVSRVVAWARKTGGEVFEQAEEAFRRERSARSFDSNLATTPEKKSDREIGS
jgi:hypothetical protein